MPRIPSLPRETRIEARQKLYDMADRGALTFPEGLAELRKSLGMSQEKFGRMVGVYRSQLAGIEGGSLNPTVETVNRLLKPFGMQLGIVRTRRRGDDER